MIPFIYIYIYILSACVFIAEINSKWFLLGFFPHSARLQKNGSYRTVKHPQTVHIHPSSGLAQVSNSCFY